MPNFLKKMRAEHGIKSKSEQKEALQGEISAKVRIITCLKKRLVLY